jgi:predicted ester cyclase
MGAEENKAVMREFLEASVGNSSARLKELLAPDFVAHLAAGPEGPDGFVQHNSAIGNAFSEKTFTVKEQVAEGDKVAARTVWEGTHSGELRGLAPTGKRIAISAFIIDRVRDGKIVEHWSLFDQMGMMQQVGVVAAPPPTK